MTPEARPLEEGERVLLIDGRGRRYLIELKAGAEFHSHVGIIGHDELIGGDEGVTLRASGGGRFFAFRPTLADYILKMKRGAQVVYPKDIGLILVYADIFPGATVLEAGSGSAALTLGLARGVGESGRVISYELREDHHAQAVRNLRTWYSSPDQQPPNVELRVGDVFEERQPAPVDRIVLDLPEPWRAVGTATDALRAGGVFCSYLPTIPQVQQTVAALRQTGFVLIQTLEGLVRTWNIEGASVRPDHRMVAHTGFIITARKPTTYRDTKVSEAARVGLSLDRGGDDDL